MTGVVVVLVLIFVVPVDPRAARRRAARGRRRRRAGRVSARPARAGTPSRRPTRRSPCCPGRRGSGGCSPSSASRPASARSGSTAGFFLAVVAAVAGGLPDRRARRRRGGRLRPGARLPGARRHPDHRRARGRHGRRSTCRPARCCCRCCCTPSSTCASCSCPSRRAARAGRGARVTPPTAAVAGPPRTGRRSPRSGTRVFVDEQGVPPEIEQDDRGRDGGARAQPGRAPAGWSPPAGCCVARPDGGHRPDGGRRGRPRAGARRPPCSPSCTGRRRCAASREVELHAQLTARGSTSGPATPPWARCTRRRVSRTSPCVAGCLTAAGTIPQGQV